LFGFRLGFGFGFGFGFGLVWFEVLADGLAVGIGLDMIWRMESEDWGWGLRIGLTDSLTDCQTDRLKD
jgi:hypothetical protein